MHRRSFMVLAIAALGAVAGTILLTPASSLADNKAAKKAPETWVVIKITDANGDEYKAVRSTEVAAKRKEVAEENKKAKDDYKDARKSDPKAEKPVITKLKIVKSGFTTEKGAKDYIEKVARTAMRRAVRRATRKTRVSRPRPSVAADRVPRSRISHRVPPSGE